MRQRRVGQAIASALCGHYNRGIQARVQVILDNVIGEFLALGAALIFGVASAAYTIAGRKFGASFSMALSLLISLAFYVPLHQVLHGKPVPLDAEADRWLILGLSSLAGFVISALFLLRSFQYIGPRLTMLIGSTSPIFAALMAWTFLGQQLPTFAILGIVFVVGGVVWVVSERDAQPRDRHDPNYVKGLSMAVAAAVAQGAAFVLMSEGVAGGFSPMSAGLIRTVVAIVLLWVFIALRGVVLQNLRLIASSPRALAWLVLASLSGPVAGTTLILASLQFTSVGISSTLTNTTPIFLIPIAYLAFGERITARAVAGTFIAIAGVALLFAA